MRQSLTHHEVATAYECDWSRLKNGELLDAAEKEGFEVLVTTDSKCKRPVRRKTPMKPNAVVFCALSVLALAPACVSAQDRYPSLYTRLPYDSARDFGREPATTGEAREIFGIRR